uniref:Uncharacterized protein n=1 Tax=Setaria italica TaxID=4555 RepID=K3YW56_SETIT
MAHTASTGRGRRTRHPPAGEGAHGIHRQPGVGAGGHWRAPRAKGTRHAARIAAPPSSPPCRCPRICEDLASLAHSMSAMEGGHVGTSKMNGACAFNQYRKEEMIPAPQKMNYGEDPSWCRQWQRVLAQESICTRGYLADSTTLPRLRKWYQKKMHFQGGIWTADCDCINGF